MGLYNVEDVIAKQVESMLNVLPDAELNQARKVEILADKKRELGNLIKNDELWTGEYMPRLMKGGFDDYDATVKDLVQIKGLSGKYYPTIDKCYVVYKIKAEE